MKKNEHHTKVKSISIGNFPTYLKGQRTKSREMMTPWMAKEQPLFSSVKCILLIDGGSLFYHLSEVQKTDRISHGIGPDLMKKGIGDLEKLD